MAAAKEIRGKIVSIKKTQKITYAMQKVAASKMRRAQLRMQTSMPYATKILDVVGHVALSTSEYRHVYLQERQEIKRVGYIIVSTDHGLCGGLNINLFKMAVEHARSFNERDIGVDWCLFGRKAETFFKNVKANVLAHVSNLGDAPKFSDLLGNIKVMLDAYQGGKIDRLYIVNNEFVSTMVQKPRVLQLLPLAAPEKKTKRWDYIYEPDSKYLLNMLLERHLETQVYQAVVDNLACEQVARMVAMKNATDNAGDLIFNLQLMYNKARQNAITTEITEIISGAEAV